MAPRLPSCCVSLTQPPKSFLIFLPFNKSLVFARSDPQPHLKSVNVSKGLKQPTADTYIRRTLL